MQLLNLNRVSTDTVDLLNHLLEKAKTGELTGFFFLGLLQNQDVLEVITDTMKSNVFKTIGAVEQMKVNFIINNVQRE